MLLLLGKRFFMRFDLRTDFSRNLNLSYSHTESGPNTNYPGLTRTVPGAIEYIDGRKTSPSRTQHGSTTDEHGSTRI